MKIKLSKSQWENIGKKAGWVPDEDILTYVDGNRTLKIFGHGVKDPNLKYDAAILDDMGDTESAINGVTLSEIYLWAKENRFTIREKNVL